MRPRLTTARTRSAPSQVGSCSTLGYGPRHDIGLSAHLERAVGALEAHGTGAVGGRCHERLLGREAQLEAGEAEHELQNSAWGDVPGLKSVPSATGTPRSMSARAGA